MSSPTSPIESLPEELLLSIFSHLDSSPPSATESRQEPNLEITSRTTHVYKDLSSISRKWRRVIIPLIFRFSRIHLNRTNERACLDVFLQFIRKNEVFVQSVVVTICKSSDRPRPLSQDRSLGITTFWNDLLHATKATITRIVIVAPPGHLARLTKCTIDLSTEWAFEEMDYHLLELSYDNTSSANQQQQQTKLFEPNPDRISADSILMMKPWSHLALNVS